MTSTKKFAGYTWTVLGVNLLVILWGAYVRATGSGAGCGSHWPSCNGQVIPLAPTTETMIEFIHRLTSGAAFLLVLGMFVWGLRKLPKGHPARWGVTLSMIFMVIEALVGAGLVLIEWTVGGKAAFIALHLANTFLLVASIALTAYWLTPELSGTEPGGLRLKEQGAAPWVFGLGLLLVMVIGATGAITAQGDTIFPVESLAEGIAQDFSPDSHFIIQLRVLHPIAAVVTGFYTLFLALMYGMLRTEPLIKRLATVLGVLFVVQLIAGLINLVLLAPIPMQILHLLLADLVWIAMVLLSASVLSAGEGVTAAEAQVPATSSR